MVGSGDPNVHLNFQVGLQAQLEQRYSALSKKSYSAVVGSITLDISVTTFAGNPPC